MTQRTFSRDIERVTREPVGQGCRIRGSIGSNYSSCNQTVRHDIVSDVLGLRPYLCAESAWERFAKE
jgi:hypothetical protein